MNNGYEWSTTPSSYIYHAAYDRIEKDRNNINPTFECNNTKDLYTTIESNIGNKSLSKPIGLITADEAIFAGLARNTSAYTYNNYLYTNVRHFTMTPANVNTDNAASVIYTIEEENFVGLVRTYGSTYWARPVINLKADIQLTGNGTTESPYMIVES